MQLYLALQLHLHHQKDEQTHSRVLVGAPSPFGKLHHKSRRVVRPLRRIVSLH